MPVVSATQVKKFRACPRQWGYKYLDKLPEPQGQGAAVGELGHWICESAINPDGVDWVPKQETWDLAGKDEGQVMAFMKPFLDSEFMPPPGAEAEHMFSLSIPGTKIPFVGKIDWNFPLTKGPDKTDMPCLEVGDLKTCKSFHYMLNGLTLSEDIAAQAYAAAMLSRPDWEMLKLNWVYVKTTKDRALKAHPEPRSVNIWLPRTWAEGALKAIHREAAPLVQLYEQGASAKDCEATPGEACKAFGGCKFRDICPNYQTGENVDTADINAILDKHIAEQGGQVAPVTGQPGVLPPEAVSIDDPEKQAKLEALHAQIAELSAPPVPTTPVSPPPLPAKVDVVDSGEPPKRGRGRPKGSKNKPKPAPAVETPVVEPPAVETPKVETPKVETPVGRKVLYVNCGPLRATAPWVFETEAYKKADAAATTASEKESWLLADFGKGPGLLATCFGRYIAELPNEVRINSQSPEGRALHSLLVTWADEVVVVGG